MPHVLRGYRRESQLDLTWLKVIAHSRKLREIERYAILQRSLDADNIDNAWWAKFMDGRKSRIERDVLYVEFDFESLAKSV